MRKFTLLLTMLAFVIGIPLARAEGVVSPYTEGFETSAVSGSDNNTVAIPGWGHIVDSYIPSSSWSTYKVAYYVHTTAKSGLKSFRAGSQNIGSSYDTKDVDDLLVTPAVSGTVSVWAKNYSGVTQGSIRLFRVTKDEGGEFVKGEEYTVGEDYTITLNDVENATLTYDDWSKVTMENVPDGTYLGIRLENALMDDFEAASATVVYKKSLRINSFTTSFTSIDTDAEGNFSCSFTAKVTNNGEVELTPGTEGYTLEVRLSASLAVSTPLKDEEVVGTFPITQSLAIGETIDIPLSVSGVFNLNDVDLGDDNRVRASFGLYSGFSDERGSVQWLDVYPYKPNFQLSLKDAASVIARGTVQSFGMSNGSVSKVFRFRNNTGGAPLTVTGITLPDGYTGAMKTKDAVDVEWAFPMTVPAHSEYELTVTMDAAKGAGVKSGDLVIAAQGYAEPFSYPLEGTLVDPTKWFVNFETNSFPIGSWHDSSWSVTYYPGAADNKYCAQNSNSSSLQKFISPKLRVEEGESLVFSGARRGSNSGISVYYSSDRENWILAKAVGADGEGNPTDYPFTTDLIPGGSYSEYAFTQFTVSEIPAGEWYVAFESGYARLDDIMGYTVIDVDNDVMVESCELPQSGMVNYESTASVKVANLLSNIDASEYTAKLYLNGEAVATAESSEIASQSSATFTFRFTPHATGEFPVYIELAFANGYTVKTQVATMAVAEEVPSEEISVGTKTTDSTTNTLVRFYDNNSQQEVIYPQELIGLPTGTKIVSLKIKGRHSGKSTPYTAHVKIWIENVDADASYRGVDKQALDTEGMTLIYDADFEVVSTAVSGVLFDCQIPDDFVYTGGGLRVIGQTEASTWCSVSFDADGDKSGYGRYRYNNGTFANLETGSSWSSMSNLPVIYLDIEKEASVYSGTVTEDATGNAVEGATLTLKNGGVVYEGVSAADGSFSFPVLQDNAEYALTVLKAGYFPVKKTVAFERASVSGEAIKLKEAKGFYIEESSVPTEAMVNYPYTATVYAMNANATDLAVGSYTAELLFDGEVFATAEVVEVKAGEFNLFTFKGMPREAGTVSATIRLTTDDAVAETDAVDVVVAPETASADVQIGTPSSLEWGGTANMYFKASQTEVVYPKSLIGLEAGTKILSLKMKGYSLRDASINHELKFWIENVEEGAAYRGVDGSPLNTEGMTLAYDAVYTSKLEGGATELVVIFDIPLTDFVYTGGDLRIISQQETDSYSNIKFEVDAQNQGIGKHREKDATSALAAVEAMNWFSMTTGMPVIYLGVEPKKNVSGTVTVKEGGSAVAGASITLASEDGVEYYGTTDETGAYSIDVIQYAKDYTMTVAAEGYADVVKPVSFADGNVVLNIELGAGAFATVSGTITDPDGSPVEGVRVGLKHYETEEVLADALSGADGTYVIELDEAQWLLASDESEGYSAYDVCILDEDYVEDYTIVYWDGAKELTDCNLEARLKEYTLSGYVTDAASDVDLIGASISLYIDDELFETTVSTAEGYQFTGISHISGKEVRLAATMDGYDDYSETLDLVYGNDGYNIKDIEMSAGGTDGIGSMAVKAFAAYGGQGFIRVAAPEAVTVNVYSVAGALLRSERVEPGISRLEGFTAGIYVVNGVKVAVK